MRSRNRLFIVLPVAILFGLSPKGGALALSQQGESENYKIAEWTLVHGNETSSVGSVATAQFSVGVVHGKTAKSHDSSNYIASFNFLTDDFSASVLAPSRPYFATHRDPSTAVLAWTKSPDHEAELFDGYRVRSYESPFSKQAVSKRTTGRASIVLTGLVPGEKRYATVETYWKDIQSPRTFRILYVTTEDRDKGDADGNGLTDGRDLVDALFAYDLREAPGHNAAADTDGNGVVDDRDIDRIIQNMGWKRSATIEE